MTLSTFGHVMPMAGMAKGFPLVWPGPQSRCGSSEVLSGADCWGCISVQWQGMLGSISHICCGCVVAEWWCACPCSHPVASLCAILWTVACQAPLSMGFSRQEHWSGLPCPPPGDLSNPGITPTSSVSPASPALREGPLLLSHPGTPACVLSSV